MLNLLPDALKKEAAGLLIGSRVTMPKRFSALTDSFNHSIREESAPVNKRLQDVMKNQQEVIRKQRRKRREQPA